MDYYILQSSGEQGGPHSPAELRTLWIAGEVTLNTLVWSDGMETWQPFWSIQGLIPPPPPEPPLLANGSTDAPTVEIMRLERGAALVSWTDIAAPPLIDGATTSSASKIMMGIESLRREEYPRAFDLFHASLSETYPVASPWLGLAYCEALLASPERNTVEEIRHAVNRAHEFCPAKQATISDHHGMILAVALSRAIVSAASAYNDHLRALCSTQQQLAAHQNAAGVRNAAIAVGSVAAVLGSRSTSSIGKIVGYGIAARQTLMAVDANTSTHQTEAEIEHYLLQSHSFHREAREYSRMTSLIIDEAKEILVKCNPAIRDLLDKRIVIVSDALNTFQDTPKNSMSGSKRTWVKGPLSAFGVTCFILWLGFWGFLVGFALLFYLDPNFITYKAQ